MMNSVMIKTRIVEMGVVVNVRWKMVGSVSTI